MITPAVLRFVMPALPDERAECFAPYLVAAALEFDINTAARVAAWLAQAAHESGELAHLVENLNYSAAGLRKTWPLRFPDDATATRYARQPMAIANHVYGGRLGNGPEASGDGWTYRGRGIFQLTGRANYRDAGRVLHLALEASPELLEHPEPACRSAGWFWRTRGCNLLADAGDFLEITRRINSGMLGLAERRAYWARAKATLGA